jgi:hypothetical protein
MQAEHDRRGSTRRDDRGRVSAGCGSTLELKPGPPVGFLLVLATWGSNARFLACSAWMFARSVLASALSPTVLLLVRSPLRTAIV